MHTEMGTAQTSTDTWIAQGDVHRGPESAAITIGGTPADGDLVVFELSRVVGSDNMTGEAVDDIFAIILPVVLTARAQ